MFPYAIFLKIILFIIFVLLYFLLLEIDIPIKNQKTPKLIEFNITTNSTNSFYSSKITNNNLSVLLYEELKNFTTYSQLLEDVILFIPLFDIKNGFYIDAGGFDPVYCSVTKAFYLRGWRGINIEPQPDKIKLFNQDRPNDINLQMAVGKSTGNVKIYISDQLTSLYEKNAKLLRSYANESVVVKMDTLGNICKKYVPKGTNIDFCKIDVEGNEKDSLLGFDFVNYRPKIFCMESTKPMSFVSSYKEWEDILIKNDYIFVYSKGVNRFYADKRLPDLVNRCKKINLYLKSLVFKKYTNK